MKNNKCFNFLGTWINATNLPQMVDHLNDYNYSQTGYINFPDSYVLTCARKDEKLQKILNNSLYTLPDGKPSELYAKINGHRNVSTVSGYWLCKKLLDSDKTHYFLGSTPEKLNKISQLIEIEHPNAKVLGYKSPPFKDLSFFEHGNILEKELKEINSLKPDLIWIGLSSPKQDYLMKSHAPLLQHGVMLGVGGVFDYLSGEVTKSPEWIKKIGLRWLWRLCKEPKRLGPKYWCTFKVFFSLIIRNGI